MKQPFPKSITLELDPPNFHPALVGLVEAVALAMEHQGEEVDRDELLCISGAAFSNYVFQPAFNEHEDEPREFSRLGEYFTNYGAWESIAYYTGWELPELNHLPPVEVMKVAAFELGSGRPIVTLTADLEPVMVTGYELSVDERRLLVAGGEPFDVAGEAKMQGASEVFENWMLLVRPGERAEWAASTVRQQINVLRWAVEHGRNVREFFQETRENYAPGLAGIERFREFLDGLTEPDGVEYAEAYVARLGAARRAAAEVLPRWSSPIAEAVGHGDVADALEDAAAHYRGVAEILENYETMVDAFADVEAHERDALSALTRAARHLPQPFEAI